MWCDGCSKTIKKENQEMVWHCTSTVGAKIYHSQGYDLCLECGNKQLQFKEFDTIERDSRFPVRVTLQVYHILLVLFFLGCCFSLCHCFFVNTTKKKRNKKKIKMTNSIIKQQNMVN